jgi:hypothetical protein
MFIKSDGQGTGPGGRWKVNNVITIIRLNFMQSSRRTHFNLRCLPFDVRSSPASSSSSFSSRRQSLSLEGVMALSSPMQTVSDIDDRNNDLG